MIRTTEVDGIPTLISPTAGTTAAGLVFRVGWADETLASSGITHLVEHLALHRTGMTDYHFNGATGAVTTHFHMQGSAADVVAFFDSVCQTLAELPLDRLETEKALLRAERAGRTRTPVDDAPLWRYGARTFGLCSYPEFGLNRLGAQDVAHWAASWFTRENAVFWIAGDEVPAGLRLELPAGARRPVPVATSALPTTPAYFTGPANCVAFDALVRRGPAAMLFGKVLERELYRSLRQEGGLSYTASTCYETQGGDLATVTALADAVPDQQGAVLGEFVDVLAKLRVGRIDQADLDAALAKADESVRHPDADAIRLPGMATNLLTGHPVRTAEEICAELRAVTVADVHAVATEAMASGLLMVPERHRADWAGYPAAPTRSTGTVDGLWRPSLEDDGVHLVIGADGASIAAKDEAVTVRFAECAVALAWPDGGRQLIGYDGISVRIEPTLYSVQPGDLAALDARIDPATLVRLPARGPEDIPRPEPRQAPAPTGAAGAAGPAGPAMGGFEKITGIMLAVLFVVLCCASSLCVFGTVVDPEADAESWQVVGIMWCPTIVVAAPLVVIGRRYLAQRRARR